MYKSKPKRFSSLYEVTATQKKVRANYFRQEYILAFSHSICRRTFCWFGRRLETKGSFIADIIDRNKWHTTQYNQIIADGFVCIIHHVRRLKIIEIDFPASCLDGQARAINFEDNLDG